MGSGSTAPPLVSVIVPVRNGARSIGDCLDALAVQSLAAGRWEVVVVDNGSTDGTREVVAPRPVTLIEETAVRSPYAARNAGIATARGSLLAFTDSDCSPVPDWLERATRPILEDRADLVAGGIEFSFSTRPSVGELTDALWHLDVEAQVTRNRGAMTSNLVVRRAVVEAVGPFEAGLRSGGDARWTRSATDAGFRLVYEPHAVVFKRARTMGRLLAKGYRVGTGLPAAWRERGTPRTRIGPWAAHHLLPPSPRRVREQLRRRGRAGMENRFWTMWAATWLLEGARGLGALASWIGVGVRVGMVVSDD